MSAYSIVYVEKPEESAWGIIGRGIDSYDRQKTGDAKFQRLCFALQTADGVIEGGVVAELYWGWLHIDLLWVKDELRGQGYGGRILELVEEEARKRGAHGAYLDTFSFQAPDFYKKRGCQVVAKLPDFPMGHQRYFLTKHL